MKSMHTIGASICLLATGLLLINGCTSSYMVTPSPGDGDYSYGDLNSEFADKEVVVDLIDGRAMHAEQIRIEKDSVSWSESNTGSRYKVAAGEVKKISSSNHLLGGLEALGGGILVDGVMLVGMASSSQRDFPVAGAVVLAGLPPLLVAWGLISGHRYEYRFPADSTTATH